MTEFLDLKLARRFATWDLDGNGFLEKPDFEKGAERLGDAFGEPAGSERRERMRQMCLGLWQGLSRLADADGDGRISPAEYATAFKELVLEREGAFDAAYAPFISTLMDMADHDRDGKLNRSEYLDWFVTAFGLTAHDANTAFDKVDANGDGLVSQEEMITAIRDYYCSTDPHTPGNWLLGPPPTL